MNPLGFTPEWIDLGVVTEEQIAEAVAAFEQSDDKNPEHYRYKAFRDYLAAHRPLPDEMAAALYDLGDRDPDYSMGGAMMGDIVRLKECPIEVLEKAAISERRHLVKLAAR